MNAKAKIIVAVVVVVWIVTEVAAKVMIVVPLVMMMTGVQNNIEVNDKKLKIVTYPCVVVIASHVEGDHITPGLFTFHQMINKSIHSNINKNQSDSNITNNKNNNNKHNSTCMAIESGIEKQLPASPPPIFAARSLALAPRPAPWDFLLPFDQCGWQICLGDIFSTHLRTLWKSLQLYLARAAGQFQIMGLSLVWFHVVCCQRFGILPPPLADWSLPDDGVQCG